jgi:carbamate kinase
VRLVEAGHKVVVTHGNGPQVGNILRLVELARHFLYPLPLDICGAHAQGGMGYVLQREITTVFKSRGMDKMAFTILTQALVDKDDPAFQVLTKPIGAFFAKEKIGPMIEKGWAAIEEPGRGWRRVLLSPKSKLIIEERIVKQAIEFGDVIICCGGGYLSGRERGLAI